MRRSNDSVRALVFDIDGTLVDEHKTISSNLRALVSATVIPRKMKVILASSRSDQSLRQVSRHLGVSCAFVSFDGGLVLDECHRRISEAFVDTTLAPEAFAAARKFGLTCSVFDRDGWFTSDAGYWTQREVRGTGTNPIILDETDLEDRARTGTESIYKLMFRGEADTLHEFTCLEAVQRLCQANTGYSNRPTIVEILSSKADKFLGCQRLLRLWDIPEDAVIFFGDGINDISCLSGFSHSVAMANAQEAVKHHARYVTGGNNEDGVFQYLSRLFPGWLSMKDNLEEGPG